MKSVIRWFCVFVAWPLAALFAHDPGVSSVAVKLTAERLEVAVQFSPQDFELLTRTTRWRVPDEVLAKGFLLSLDGQAAAVIGAAEDRVEGDYHGFTASFARPAAGAALKIEAAWLKFLPPNHRQLIEIKRDGVVVSAKMARAGELVLNYPLPPAPTGETKPSATETHAAPVSWSEWFKLGVEHIFTGYDHLLFLLGLLVVCPNLRAIAVIITCFTVAHSVTLGLAAMNIVSLSPGVVEPLIAASIVYVGVENLLRKGEPGGRWLLTLLFGLIHGFGFAGVLRELGLGDGGANIAVPLVSFNLGVEAGQLAIAAVGLPILWALKRQPRFAALGPTVLSVLVALAGAYWLLERTVLG